MNNTVKVGLIVILFLAGICMAFLAGQLSSNHPYPANVDPAAISHHPSAPPSQAADRSVTTENQNTPPAAIPAPGEFDSPPPDESFSEESYPETAQTDNAAAESFRPDPYELRQIFPDNRALPPVDREEFVAKQQEKERRNRQYGQIAANKATPAEIEAYYAEQTALAEDSATRLLGTPFAHNATLCQSLARLARSIERRAAIRPASTSRGRRSSRPTRRSERARRLRAQALLLRAAAPTSNTA